jgi:2-oxoisovalerate ferredoxin oxidoreductase alpha subunit
MQEGVSYLAGAELPAVVVNINRAGAGLGNVYPEQSDYTPAVKGGGHGNYRTFTLAPASAQEMCDLTIKAFEMTSKWRTPAIVFADGLQGQMMESVSLPETETPHPDFSSWAAQGESATRTNLVKSIYLDAAQQEKFNEALQAKYARMEEDAMSESYLADDAEILLVGYGISSRVARTAVEYVRKKGIKAGLFRPITLSPFPCDALAKAAKGKKILAVELDAGQFADDVRLNLAKCGLGEESASVQMINRMGGEVVTVDAVVGSVAASPQEQTSKQTAIIRHISFSTFLFIRNLLIISLFFTDTFYHFIHQKAIEPQNIGFFLFFQQFRKVFYVKNVVNQKKKWYN